MDDTQLRRLEAEAARGDQRSVAALAAAGTCADRNVDRTTLSDWLDVQAERLRQTARPCFPKQ